jgi:hypothetical protein
MVHVLDIDDNGGYDALTDGLLVIRYLSGLTGASLTSGAIGTGAMRSDPSVIATYFSGIRAQLDVDGDGYPDALTDGLLIIRYLFGLRGSSLTAGAVNPLGTRKDRNRDRDLHPVVHAVAGAGHLHEPRVELTGLILSERATFDLY